MDALMAFIPGECLNGIHTVDSLIWREKGVSLKTVQTTIKINEGVKPMMNSQWRAVQSFQENQNFISAINTLSIHIKLEMEEHSDLNRAEAVPKAKEELCDFLRELDSQVKCIEVEKKPLLGVDPRRRKFVKHLIAAKNEYRIRSSFLQEKLPVVQQLLHSDAETDKQETLLLLEELRILIEEHIGSDVEQLFGGF